MIYTISQDGFDQDEFALLLNSGFRRSGDFYYQNQCESCKLCLSYRIPVKNFSFHDWQKKIIRKNRDIKVKVSQPLATKDKESLYLSYQYHQHHLKALPGKEKDFNELEILGVMYHQMYDNPESTKEIELWLGDLLLGFAILDVAANLSSAVYSVYHPHFERRSLGSFMILQMLEWTIQKGLDYFHLGLFIPQHPKMDYKSRFKPAEILDPYSLIWQEGDKIWDGKSLKLESR
jgi:arginine-tRNA-protein transferase